MLSIVCSTAFVSGTFSSSRILIPGIAASDRRALRVGLVVAVVPFRPDVDEADGVRLVGGRGGGRGARRGGVGRRRLLVLVAPDDERAQLDERGGEEQSWGDASPGTSVRERAGGLGQGGNDHRSLLYAVPSFGLVAPR